MLAMFTRRFKLAFARCCVALLVLHGAVAAYACPAFLGELQRMEALGGAGTLPVHGAAAAEATGEGCEGHGHGPAQGIDPWSCHQHYAGDQSVGTASLASAAGAPMLPLANVTFVAPAVPADTIPPLLLQRSTAPPLSIQFLVLRI